MEKILIVGANGTTGKQVVECIHRSDNYEAYAMVRKKEQQKRFEEKGVKTILGDLEENVSHVVEGVDKVIFAAGSGGNTSEEKTILVDQEGAKKIIDASKNAGIKKFVMLSAIKADEPESNPELENYLKAKLDADKHLQQSGLNYTIVRPGTLTNDKATGTIEVAKKLDDVGKVTRADVAHVLVHVLNDDVAQNEVFEMIGGDIPVEDAI